MFKKHLKLSCLVAAFVLTAPGWALAAEPMDQAVLDELRALKARVLELENNLEKAHSAASDARKAAAEARQTSTRSLKLSEQLSKTKKDQPQGLLSEAGKRLKLYGAVEVEASWERKDKKKGKSETSSDVSLATAELFVEAAINDYTKGVLHFLYEEGGSDSVEIDEAFILLGQTEKMPWYLMGGRIYPAVGLFESSFVSDPLSLELFETQETAGEIGYAGRWFNVGVGTFNSAVHQRSDDPDSMINTYYGRFQFDAPNDFFPDGDIAAGIAYVNNIAASNFLRDHVVDQRLENLVGGWSAMVRADYRKFSFTAEYITALDDFKAGELDFADGKKTKPWAYNLELAYRPTDAWTFAGKYEKAGDVFEEFPETRWGAVASWQFLPDTVLSLEYLRGEFENGDTTDTVTTQLAVSF